MKKMLIMGLVLLSSAFAYAQSPYSQLQFADPVMQNLLGGTSLEPKKISISYDSPFTLYNIAFERFKNGNIKPAYDDLKNLLENAGTNDYFYIKSAENMAKIGFYSLSELAMDKIKENDIANIVTEDIRHYYFPKDQIKQKKELYLAELYSNIVYNEQSGETINELLNAGLDDDYTNYLMAFAYFQNKDYKNAQIYIDKAVDINPDNIRNQILKVEILAENGQEREALKLIKKLSSKQIYSVIFTDKIRSSEKYVQYKLAKNSNQKNYYLGYYYYYEKAFEKAIRTITGISKKDKNTIALLSRIYYDTNEYDKALGFAHKAKNVALANEVIGDYFYRKENYVSAEKAYRRAAALDKKNYGYSEKLAQTYVALDEKSRAKNIFEDVIMKSNNAYLSYYNLALLDSSTTQQYLKKCVAINTMFTDGWLELAKYELDKQNYKNADNYLKIVKSIDENNFKYYYYLGLLCEKQGQAVDAKANYQKALLINPDYAPAKEALNI
ncbi:tetratricopeptide repeat protein [bacterium]|nr:tetratricopeptide repeat protein [bacterium]